MFKENSWFFRNALVRANYADYPRGVKREWGYLEAFFRNLLLGEKNELKSRYLLIGIDRPPPRFEDADAVKVVRKGGQKTAERLLEIVKRNPAVTQVEMMRCTGLFPGTSKKSERAVWRWRCRDLRPADKRRDAQMTFSICPLDFVV